VWPRGTHGKIGLMELEALLNTMDRAAANLEKLERVWERAQPFIPTGPAAGSNPEYDDLRRVWADLLEGLPPINGWTVTELLPDIDAIGQGFLDYADLGEPPFALLNDCEAPGRELAEYRHRLKRARRRATSERLEQLVSTVDVLLPQVIDGLPRDSRDRIESADADEVRDAVDQIGRLMADTAEREGRWGDLYRHLWFGQGVDWHDIADHDWPSVRADVEAGAFADTDPLPVPSIDLGAAAAGELTGDVTVALPWERLDDDGFERLLFDLLRSYRNHQNVQWLMKTRAPDRGRDLSFERRLPDATGGVRIERVMVQAKHWLTKSVSPADIAATLAVVGQWEPPVIRGLIIATSGRFTQDAVAAAERHNDKGLLPLIELWPESKLEMLLSQKPGIAAGHGLR
jgi:hypothetical protein